VTLEAFRSSLAGLGSISVQLESLCLQHAPGSLAAARLVRDPAVQRLALTWMLPQLVGTVDAMHLDEVRSAVVAEAGRCSRRATARHHRVELGRSIPRRDFGRVPSAVLA